jgi:hypothetical protein
MDHGTHWVVKWQAGGHGTRFDEPHSDLDLIDLLRAVVAQRAMATLTRPGEPEAALGTPPGQWLGLEMLASTRLHPAPTPSDLRRALTGAFDIHGWTLPRSGGERTIRAREPLFQAVLCDRVRHLPAETLTYLRFLWHQARPPISLILLNGIWRGPRPAPGKVFRDAGPRVILLSRAVAHLR